MIPKDPVMLLSYVNTQLRDNYASLDEFCGAMDVEKEELLSALGKIQYVDNPETNQFL